MSNSRHERVQVEIEDIIKIELLGYLRCEKGWQGDVHTHPFWEIIYIPSKGVLTSGEVGTIHSMEDRFFIIEPHKKHRVRNISDSTVEMIYVGFDFNFAPSSKADINIGNFILSMPETKVLISEMNEFFNDSGSNRRLTLNHARGRILRTLSMILTNLITYKIVNDNFENLNLKKQVIIEKIKRYLEKNVHLNINMKTLASEFYLSPNYLGDLFKKVTGMSIKQYHNKVKMEASIMMLRNSGQSVTEIARQLGYDDLAYFSKCFKNYFNISPSQIKKNP